MFLDFVSTLASESDLEELDPSRVRYLEELTPFRVEAHCVKRGEEGDIIDKSKI